MKKTIKFNKKFYKFYEIYEKIKRGEPLTLTEMNFIGSRWSGKTYQIMLFIALLMTIPRDIIVYISRQNFKSLRNTFKEMKQILDKIGIDYESWENQRLRVGNSEIYFMSSNTNKSDAKKFTGTPDSSLYDYVISFIEEITEFEEDDVDWIDEAMRGYKNHRYIKITASNPWIPENWYVSYFAKHLPFNKAKQMKGEMLEAEIDGKYFHVSTWRLNRWFLPKQLIKKIGELEKNNPIRAEVVSYGMPGIEVGAIYADYMTNVRPLNWRPTEFVAGVDYGIKRDRATINLCGRAPEGNGWKIGVLEEWGHTNVEGQLQMNSWDLAKHMVDQVIYWKNKYYLDWLTVYVDSSAVTFIELLEREASNRGVEVTFRPCIKTRIDLRIDQVRGYMSLGQFYINNHCVETIREFRSIIWDPNNTTSKPKRIDRGDHHINNVEYAIQPWLGSANALDMYGL